MSLCTEQEVIQANDFLTNKFVKPQCPGCIRGVRMCYHTPCMGTVEDMERLIDAGYAANLMLDWWGGTNFMQGKDSSAKYSKSEVNPFTEDVRYLAPAIVGHESSLSPILKNGTCNLLVNGQCSLHDKGLKPTQGRIACCKTAHYYLDSNGEKQDLDERVLLLKSWNTEKGKNLIERWKKEVGYQGSDQVPLPTNIFEQLELYLSAMCAQDETDKRMAADGLDPNVPNDFEQEEIFYEKCY